MFLCICDSLKYFQFYKTSFNLIETGQMIKSNFKFTSLYFLNRIAHSIIIWYDAHLDRMLMTHDTALILSWVRTGCILLVWHHMQSRTQEKSCFILMHYTNGVQRQQTDSRDQMSSSRKRLKAQDRKTHYCTTLLIKCLVETTKQEQLWFILHIMWTCTPVVCKVNQSRFHCYFSSSWSFLRQDKLWRKEH